MLELILISLGLIVVFVVLVKIMPIIQNYLKNIKSKRIKLLIDIAVGIFIVGTSLLIAYGIICYYSPDGTFYGAISNLFDEMALYKTLH